MSLLSLDELRKLVEQPQGICVSLYMPTVWAGSEVLQNPIRYKNLIKQAEVKLEEHQLRHTEALEVLRPAMDLDQEDFWQHQDRGLAVFLAKDFLQYYQVPLNFDELVVVGDCFHLKPLLPLLTCDGRFYILTLSQQEVKLLEATRYRVQEVEVEGMPKSLDEALQYDETAKEGQFRIQTSKGGTNNPYPNAGSYHGQGSPDRDEHQNDILQYFHTIDEVLHPYLRDKQAPLMLVGVEYLLPLYREANTYPNLLDESIPESAKGRTSEDLQTLALPLVEPYFMQAQQQAMERYQELSNTDKTSTDLNEAVAAAHYGRVDQLFVPLGVQQWGSFDAQTSELQIHATAEPGDEDLLNTAAVQTLLNGGTVYAVEPEQVPDTALIAAVFRY